MNVQDAKSLTIPEGSVKMIHDNGNRLLWGAVGYNTKYAGDTTQQTTTGKNLFNFGQLYANRADITVNDGTLTITPDSLEYAGHTGTGSQFYPAHDAGNKSIYGMTNLQPSTTYTISYTATGNTQCWLFFFNASNTRTSVNSLFNTTNVSYTFTTPADLSWYTVRIDNRTSANIISNIQIEAGSPSTPYEKYTGGQPSPNPDYPQPINVVTGLQTVTVSDGGNNIQTYTIDLATTELCKIGAYQDKIYKNGGNWYIYKECNKSSVNTNDITLNSNYSNIEYAQIPKPSDSVFYGNYQETTYPLMFTHAEHIAPSGGFNKSDWYGKIFMSAQTNRYWVGFVKGTGLDTIKTDLSGAKLYYPMANSTEVQIVDTNLIAQLNYVHEWLTRYGYNATVSSDLPIVIEKTNLP